MICISFDKSIQGSFKKLCISKIKSNLDISIALETKSIFDFISSLLH